MHVIETLSPAFGGPVSVVRKLAEAQAAKGHSVSIITTNSEFPNRTLPVICGIPHNEEGVSITYFKEDFKPLKFSLSFSSRIREIIGRHDILHSHCLYRFPATYAATVARKMKKPVVISPHGALDIFLHKQSAKSLFLKRIWERLFDVPNLCSASLIHFTSEEERVRSAHLGILTPSFIVPNGLDWRDYKNLPKRGIFRTKYGLSKNLKLILFLGRLNFKKGLDLLIPAFAIVREKDINAHLVIVGPDNDGYGRTVKELVFALNLSSSVTFLEMLTGSSVNEAYVDADVFALPSYSENFGMTVIEALACETPVVISDQVAIHREIQSSGCGIVTSCDPQKIALALLDILTDLTKSHQMGVIGRELVDRNYTWENIVDQFDKHYRSLIPKTETGKS